jgi:DNA-binding response OmpR family regulator
VCFGTIVGHYLIATNQTQFVLCVLRGRTKIISAMSLVANGTVVMIVDDDLDLRSCLADVLSMEGYEVRPLPSADSAWAELVAGEKPAAIVLDQWIVGMSSGEFVARLRASAFADIPLLMLSGAPAARKVVQDLDAVLLKPVESTTLVRAVDRLIGARRRSPVRAQPSVEAMRQVA